jgi:ABC-2 type transport system permease protein
MTMPSDALPSDAIPSGASPDRPLGEATAAPAALAATRPFYWSVRRELWENRSLYIAPLIAAGVVLFGFLVGSRRLVQGLAEAGGLPQGRHAMALAVPYDIAAAAVLAVSLIVGAVYCLGALFNERRDRSLLFWKSLPVSDLTTVLAKAAIPLAVTPVIAFVVALALQLVLLLLSTVVLAGHGVSPAPLWTAIPWPRMTLALAYGLIALSLWYAPIYAWFLLVSGWAKRVTFIWAVLPPVGLCVLEKIALDTWFLGDMLGRRLTGALAAAFSQAPDDADTHLRMDPARFLGDADLWGGLIVAGALLAATVWQRRRRDAI